MLTKDIRKLQPNWEIWRDGCVRVQASVHVPSTVHN